MVRGLLVLGCYSVGPTRELPADATRRRAITWATKGPVRDASRRGYRLRESTTCEHRRKIRRGLHNSPCARQAIQRYIFSGDTQCLPLKASVIRSQTSAEPSSSSRNRAGRRSLVALESSAEVVRSTSRKLRAQSPGVQLGKLAHALFQVCSNRERP